MNNAINKTASIATRQRGAALVVSLILLTMLTLLAVSTMSTASLEVTMAGNDQFGENAFQLAETATEQYLQTVEANFTVCVNEQNPGICDIPATAVNQPGFAGTFQTQSAFISDVGDCPLSSVSEVIRFDFELQATGQSADNALSQHTQGWVFCNP